MTALAQIPIGQSKADLILINERAVVYEIKTELDSFGRLLAQIEDYRTAFAHVCVVTSERLFEKAAELVEGTPVTIGIFRLETDIEIIELAGIDAITPFTAHTVNGIDYLQYSVNLPTLRMIGKDLARPLRRQDSPLDYRPTQYICDYAKSLGFDGMQYPSTMYQDGFNVAVFDEHLFHCVETVVYDVTSLSYSFNAAC